MQYSVPDKIKLLTVGDNDSSKGACKYDPSMKDSLNEIFRSHGPYTWDRDHAMLSKEAHPDDKLSMGWSNLVADDEGVHAINNEWTDLGEEFIKTGKYRKFSLACVVDENEELSEVVNIALCNLSADQNAWLQDSLRQRSISVNFKKDNMKSKKIEKVAEQVVEQEKVEIRAEEVEEDKQESTDTEETEEREETPEEQKVEDSKFQELSDKIAALESLVAELSDQIERKRSEEAKKEDEKETEEKRSLLQNRSESVRKYYMTRPLAEVKTVLRAFIQDSAPIQPLTKKVPLIEETKKESKGIKWTQGAGFGIPRK